MDDQILFSVCPLPTNMTEAEGFQKSLKTVPKK